MGLIFTNEARVEEIKAQVREDERMRWELEHLAEAAMNVAPQSVTFHKSPAVSGDPHDYYSEGPYWWPNPEDPNGPYIRRDGEINPGRFDAHVVAKNTLTQTVSVLAQAGVTLDERRYLARAVELLRVWFLDKETRMNPHLDYGQAIRGICSGRGIGIIDLAVMLRVIHAADLVQACGGFEREVDGLKAWFAEYLHWMNTSPNGLEEKNHPNNHSNWWNTQAAAYSAFVGDQAILEACFDRFMNHILPNQMNEEGAFTAELTRTRSYHYTLYNLEASAILCEIAWQKGVDLWHAQDASGKGMSRGVAFFAPYYSNPFLWRHEEIKPDSCLGESITMKWAAQRLDNEQVRKANEMRRANVIPCSQMCHVGIVDLI